MILDNLVFRDAPVPTENLVHLRRQIDQLDNDLVEILAKRMNISREIGKYKKNHNMPIVQPGRYGDIMHTRVKTAAAAGVDEEFMSKILSTIHEESVRLQVELTEKK